jgi:hypothetical protein
VQRATLAAFHPGALYQNTQSRGGGLFTNPLVSFFQSSRVSILTRLPGLLSILVFVDASLEELAAFGFRLVVRVQRDCALGIHALTHVLPTLGSQVGRISFI